jgi:hypothetical protein
MTHDENKTKKVGMKKSIFEDFNNTIHGSYGCFQTPSGKVNYLQVSARITASGVTFEDELAGKLVPVREILNTKLMNFGELLQRDLDDHRVAIQLVPYILKGNDIGPSYFPPIQAILLPFEVSENTKLPDPIKSFGAFQDTPVDEDRHGLHWKGYQYGNSYRFEKLSFEDGELVPIKEGKLRWHDKKSRLVVIDGQHRAMAMLAIYRTLHDSWRGAGSQYRHFYESKIMELLNEDSVIKERLKDGIEYPVTITWFDDTVDHHKAARKLFVDVNKNAKAPTKSRLILLGETELKDVFSRTILNSLRQSISNVPIYAIEFDYGISSNSQTGKWSSLANIEMIKSVIARCVWGPNKYITDLSSKVSSGRDRNAELDLRFRSQLQIESWFPADYISSNGDSYLREELGNFNFPREKLCDFEEKFIAGWGNSIIYTLSNFLPYKAHIVALENLKTSWTDTVDNEAVLAIEAIFDGVGLFWTLKDSHQHWKEKPAGNEDTKPDTVKAWDYLTRKESEFHSSRAKQYLNESDKFTTVQDMFNKTNSYACLLGLNMTVASIANNNNLLGKDIFNCTERVIKSINGWLEKSVDGKRRKLFLSSKTRNTLNLLPKLDQPHWVYFRYYWFEVLSHVMKEGDGQLNDDEIQFVDEQLPIIRRFYFEAIIYPEQMKAIEKISDNVGEALNIEVMDSATKKYNKILTHWFDSPFE